MAKQGVYADLPLPESWTGVLAQLRPQAYQPVGRALPSLGLLVDACLNLLPADRIDLIWRRFGPEQTLQEVGDIHGITRERVRQVVSKTSKILLRDAGIRPVLDGVFTGLGRDGAVLVEVAEAYSQVVPHATASELWTFLMNVWNELQKRGSSSVRVSEGVFLFSPNRLPDERVFRLVLQKRASFLYPFQLAACLGVAETEVEAIACAFPKLMRTAGGLYGCLYWSAPTVLKAVAEQLARADILEWHYSEIGKAAAVFDLSFTEQNPRNAAALLSRQDVQKLQFFEQAGRKGYWRLRSVGDGHDDNCAALRAVLEASDLPLHWSQMQARLDRNVKEGTITALLGREPEFQGFGAGVFGLTCKTYPEHYAEDTFMDALFRQRGLSVLPAEMVCRLADEQGMDAERLVNLGHLSTVFRYWKWRDSEALFLTVQEANYRHFQRWYYHRQERDVPPTDVLRTGLAAAFEQRDRATLVSTYRLLQERDVPLPPEAMHWVDWALG